MKKRRTTKLELYWQIIIGIVIGVLFGFVMSKIPGGKLFIINWVAPFGVIFIRLLKLIAIPLILVSLIKGVADLKHISKIQSYRRENNTHLFKYYNHSHLNRIVACY
ncbi:MAG: cation:dicarboxylate symporter family transporter [Paludibacteraceae bacterium]